VVAALQLYSDKTQVTHKGKSLHPVRASLLNIRFGTRIKNYRTVAYLPIFHKDPLMKDNTQRLVKLTLYSKCLSLLLDKMKESSQKGTHLYICICFFMEIKLLLKKMIYHLLTGTEVEDPWGNKQVAFVRLFSYVVDNPEIADVWCTKQGSTKHPCEICLCPWEDLLKIGKTFLCYE